MGDGSTNPNTESGLLPATSNSSPYALTSTGVLYNYEGIVSGDIWKAFDQVPAIGENSSGNFADEYVNYDAVTSTLRGFMIDLGVDNEKCFDKFTYAFSRVTETNLVPWRILIQGSNDNSVIVSDNIDSTKWESLYMGYTGYGYSEPISSIGSSALVDPAPLGGWGSWINYYLCANHSVAYRYYRVLFGASEYNSGTWDANNVAAISEFRFIEEGQAAPKVVKLILSMNGADESQVFIDSSAAPHTVVAAGNVKQDTGWYQLGTAAGQFDSSSDYLSIADTTNWEVFNNPFTIHFWFRPVNITENQNIFKQYQNDSTYMLCTYNHSSKLITFEVKIWHKQRIYMQVTADLVLNEFSHIAIVGS